MNFLSNMSNVISIAASKALKISPHLVKILQTIVSLNNSPNLSPAQWTIVRVGLQGLIMKLERGGYVFTNMPDLASDALSVAYYAPILRVLKATLDDVRVNVQRHVFQPILLAKLFPSNTIIDHQSRSDNIMAIMEHELEHSDIVTPNPGSVMVTQMHHIAGVLPVITDGLLALSRINPSRILSRTGSLFIRDVSFCEMIFKTSNWELISEKVKELKLYDIETVRIGKTPNVVVRLHPRQTYIDDQVSMAYYGVPLDELNVYVLLRIGSHGHEKSTLDASNPTAEEMWMTFLYMDSNFGPRSVYSKLIGSAITSLSFSLDLVSLIGMHYAVKFGDMTLREADHEFRERFATFHFSNIYDIVNPQALNALFNSGLVLYDAYVVIFNNTMEALFLIKEGIENLGMFEEEVVNLFGFAGRNPSDDRYQSFYPPVIDDAMGMISPFDRNASNSVKLLKRQSS